MRSSRLNRSLILAIERSDTDAVLSVLKDGADPNVTENAGRTPITLQDLVNVFVHHPVHARGDSALFLALDSDIDPGIPEDHDLKEGHFVTTLGPGRPCSNTRMVEALIDYGARVNIQDDLGRTPLHYAAMCNTPMAQLLLERGAQSIARDRWGNTPLLHCFPSRDMIARLLKFGADVDAANNDGQTALMIAVESCDISEVETLLKYGANPMIADKHGQNPLKLAYSVLHSLTYIKDVGARQNGATMQKIIHLLLSAGAER
jgi:ankyrin repeat protein